MRLFVMQYDVTKERFTRTYVGFSQKLQYFFHSAQFLPTAENELLPG